MLQVGAVYVAVVAVFFLLLWLSEMQWASDIRYRIFRLINWRFSDEKTPAVRAPFVDKASSRGGAVPQRYSSLSSRNMLLAQKASRLAPVARAQSSPVRPSTFTSEPIQETSAKVTNAVPNATAHGGAFDTKDDEEITPDEFTPLHKTRGKQEENKSQVSGEGNQAK